MTGQLRAWFLDLMGSTPGLYALQLNNGTTVAITFIDQVHSLDTEQLWIDVSLATHDQLTKANALLPTPVLASQKEGAKASLNLGLVGAAYIVE